MEQEAILRRLDRLEKDVDALSIKIHSFDIAQATVDEKLNSMMSTLQELKDGVNLLRQVPAKRYEAFATAVISSVAAMLSGFIWGQLS